MYMSYKAKQYTSVPTICLKSIALPVHTFGALSEHLYFTTCFPLTAEVTNTLSFLVIISLPLIFYSI